MRFKAVFFDFWETLFGFVEENMLEKMRDERAKRFAKILDMPEDVVKEAFFGVIVDINNDREKTGFEYNVYEVLELFLKRVGRDISYMEMIHDAFVDVIYKYIPGLNPGAKEVINTLKDMDIKLAIISNTIHGEVEKRLLKESGLWDIFDTAIFSCEVRVRKPRRDIFDIALNRLDVSRQNVVHIGDSVDADVQGALRAGIWAIHYGSNSVFAHASISHFNQLISTLKGMN